MGRADFLPYVVEILDNAQGVVDPNDPLTAGHLKVMDDCFLIGFQTGFEPTFWAVRSYLGVPLDQDEAEEIVEDYLIEKGWFNGGVRPADYAIPPA